MRRGPSGHDRIGAGPRRAGRLAAAALAMIFGCPSARAEDRDCFQQLIDARDPVIACTFPVAMTPEELAQVRKITRDVLRDAHCLMTIRIERRLVDDAMSDPLDHEFAAPAQPVACEVETSSRKLPINFTFAPRVTFKGGVAVSASPGMADVTGVPRVLSWPVQTWVNNSGSIRRNMLLVINAFMKQFPRKS